MPIFGTSVAVSVIPRRKGGRYAHFMKVIRMCASVHVERERERERGIMCLLASGGPLCVSVGIPFQYGLRHLILQRRDSLRGSSARESFTASRT